VQASTTANAKAAIVKQRGLHARPCHTLVRCALEFSGQVEISCEGRTANGKSILELMTLSAGKGAVLEFKATGEGAQDLVASLVGLVQSGFQETD
jgi:phosphotransferase system HPr (HPr) family protein